MSTPQPAGGKPNVYPEEGEYDFCIRCGGLTKNKDKVCDDCKKDLDTDRFVVVP